MPIKLTTQKMTTHNGHQWALGEWISAKGSGNEPCTDGVIHYYDSIVAALMFNPIHSRIDNPRAFEIEIDSEIGHDGLKGWCKSARLVWEIPIPAITTEQRVTCAIRCALIVYHAPGFVRWANEWLSGTDRTSTAANAAANAAYAAADAAARAAYAAANAADAAADAAAYAADAAAYAAANAAYGVTGKQIADILESVCGGMSGG